MTSQDLKNYGDTGTCMTISVVITATIEIHNDEVTILDDKQIYD